jgi:LAO/AO transport system kinase
MTAGLAELVDRARARNKHAIARLVAVFEDTRPTGPARRAQVLELLAATAPADRRAATVLGLTGTPGAGKSSLLARVVPRLLELDPALSVAVLAIDPASHVSRGALLGDRTRTRFGADDRAYFRSQSNATELGGLAPTTFQVSRLLAELFDLVIVETVGIGQSELDVRHLADHVVLVLQPLGGDEIQFLKAGIIEVPDSFVLNKCDDPAAGRSYYQLRSALALARPFDTHLPAIHRTSARTGEGIDELSAAILAIVVAGRPAAAAERDTYFFERWIGQEWGAVGTRFAASHPGGAAGLLAEAGGYDAAQERVGRGIVDAILRQDRERTA